MNEVQEGGQLDVTDEAKLRAELNVIRPETLRYDPSKDQALEEQCEQAVEAIFQLDPNDFQGRASGKAAAESMGVELQEASAKKLDLLNAPIHRLAGRGDDGGDVGNALADLKIQVEKADPRRFDFEPGWFSRMLGALPFVGTPIKRYLTRYESTRTVIDATIRSLDLGRDQLKRDNLVLSEDQAGMRDLTGRLEKAVKMGRLMDQKIEARAAKLPDADSKRKFLTEEVLFPLRQRVIDLQQQLAVNQQGIVATELIIRNNNELIRGVTRAVNVTSRALQVAATVAIALADQKAVLNKVEAVNQTTSDLLAGTARQLKEQGAAIQRQASSATLDMDALRSAFADIDAAIEDLSTFRGKALPAMARTIRDLDQLNEKARESVKKIDTQRAAEGGIRIDV